MPLNACISTVTQGERAALQPAGQSMYREAFMRDRGKLPKTHTTATQPPRREPSDETLIQLIVKRDKRPCERYLRDKLKIYRFILRVVGDAPLADDIVSDVFLDVWRRADTFEAKSQVSTWLLAIARNKALGARRRLAATSLDCDVVSAIIDPADDLKSQQTVMAAMHSSGIV